MIPLGEIDVSRDERIAIKALRDGHASEEMQRLVYRFIVDELAGVRQIDFSLPSTEAVMGWYEGRRFVGLAIEDVADAPIPEEGPAEPLARTMLQKAEARNRARG